MALDSLVAKANTGEGIDRLAGRSTAGGFVGAAMLTDNNGVEVAQANPLPARLYGITETPEIATVTSSGNTTSGALSVSITNVGLANGTVGGATIAPGLSINISASPGNNIASFSYDATGTTFLIVTMSENA